MAVRNILFDLDGTLLDTAPDFILCVNRLRERHHLPPLADATIRAQVSNGARALTRLAMAMDDNDPALEDRRQELLSLYREELGLHSQLFPGIAESLQWIEAQGLAWGIVTNKPSAFTVPLLERLQLPYTPASVVCPDHVQRTKPDPEPLLLACQQTGCTAAEAIYLGDHARDIEAGRAAGMPTASCLWGYIEPGDDPRNWQGNFLLEHASEIPDLIKKLI